MAKGKKQLFVKRGQDFEPLPDKKWFIASVMDIDIKETQYGENFLWTFRILQKGDWANRQARGFTGSSVNLDANTKSKLLHWIETLEDVEDFEELDVDVEDYNVAELIGTKCAIFVEQSEGKNKETDQAPLVDSFDLPSHRGNVLLKPGRRIGSEDNP